jgi:hypothetical protein
LKLLRATLPPSLVLHEDRQRQAGKLGELHVKANLPPSCTQGQKGRHKIGFDVLPLKLLRATLPPSLVRHTITNKDRRAQIG